MFTGIVQGTARVAEVIERHDARRLRLLFPKGALDGAQIGASICLSGVCLTLVEQADNEGSFDVIEESLACTTLGELILGAHINYERSATFGTEIGGHLVSGHVMGVAEVIDVRSTDTNRTLTLRMPQAVMPYMLPKGFVSLDGCSLTLGDVDDDACTVQVHLIPETLRVTTFGHASAGTRINVEVDPMTQAVVTTVHRVMARQGQAAIVARNPADR